MTKKRKEWAITPTRKQGAYLQYLLKCAGISGSDIAYEVDTTRQNVRLIIVGLKHSARIESCIAEKLGYANWNDLLRHVQSVTSSEEVA